MAGGDTNMDLTTLGWDRYQQHPWKIFKSPLDQWEVLPTFLIGEYLFLLMPLFSLVHAWQHSKLHLFVWLMTFLVGTTNDLFFMTLPSVDNFWQSQATFMITPRLPLYIPCVYNVFMYWPVVASWRTELSWIGQAALGGILAGLTYAPYDLIGVKFLWWTWHDTHAVLRYRLLDVPVGSTLWTITFVASFSFLISYTTQRRVEIGLTKLSFSFLALSAFTTPLMMVMMGVFQLTGAESLPSLTSLIVCISVFGAVVSISYFSRQRVYKTRRDPDTLGRSAISAYVSILTLIAIFGQPENHVSVGLHQRIGPCYVGQHDTITQTTHHEFLCAHNHSTTVWVLKHNESKREWYAVHGTTHTNFRLWLGVVLFLLLIGYQLYIFIFKTKCVG